MNTSNEAPFPLVTLNEFASLDCSSWLDGSTSDGNFTALKPKLIDKEFLQSRMGFTRLYQLVHHVAEKGSSEPRHCFDVLLRLNSVALSAPTTARRALFLARNLFVALVQQSNEAHDKAQLHQERWRAVCVQCVEQWHGVLKQSEGDDVHDYLQPAVLALISSGVVLKSSALIASCAELMCTVLQCRTHVAGDSIARTHRTLLVQQLIDKPLSSAVLAVFFDKVMQLNRAWALHFLQHIVAALKHCERAARKNRKDTATHLVAFMKECCTRDGQAVALFAEELLDLYATAASPTRRVLVDVLLSLAHDWSLLLALARDSDAHIRARGVSAAVVFDAASSSDRLRVVTAALSDDSKLVRLQAVKALQRLHDTQDTHDAHEYSSLFYDTAMPELYRMLNVHPAAEKWSKDIVRAIESLMSSNVMVELHHLLPCFGFNDETLGCSVSRIIARALRLPGESEFALYAAVSLSLLAARLNANELELFEQMIAHMMREHDRSARELVNTLFAVFFEPTRHLHSFCALLEQHDVRRHTVSQSQSSALRLGAVIVLAHLSHTCEADQFIGPLVQYLEEFTLQAQSRTLNESQFDYFQRLNNFALQILAHSSTRVPHAAIDELCAEYLLTLIKLGNVRASVRLLYTLRDRPLECGAKLLKLYEGAMVPQESVAVSEMCRFVELIGEVMAQSTPYVTRVIESSVQEQDCKDELTRRHVIDERVTHAIEALTAQDEFFARYVPLVAACVVSNHALLSRAALLSLGRMMTTSLALARQYLPLLHDVRVKGEFVAEVLVIYGDLLVQYPRDTAALLAALVTSLDDTQPLTVQHTAARVLSALAIHRLIKHELVLPTLARQLLHSDASLAALALSFFAQLAARESSAYTRHVLLIYNELHDSTVRVSIIRTLLQFCRDTQKTELVELWSRELSAERVQLLSGLLPTARSLAHLQHARTTQPQLCAALVPHLLLGKQRGSVAVKTTCCKLLGDVQQNAAFEE